MLITKEWLQKLAVVPVTIILFPSLTEQFNAVLCQTSDSTIDNSVYNEHAPLLIKNNYARKRQF